MWLSLLGWIAGLWVAAGVEAAWGGGMPGPLLLVALAAGLWAGPVAGVLVGAGAGLCDAALFGHNLLLTGAVGMACGGGASLVAKWFARRNLLVALLTAACFTLLSMPLLTWSSFYHPANLMWAVLRRACENALWMIPIYGILLLSFRGSSARFQWE